MIRPMQLSPDEVNAFISAEYPSSFAAGYRTDDLGDGFAQVRWRYDPTTLRPGGFISGPTQFTVADMALWVLSFTILGLQPMAVTSDVHITFLRPAVGGDLIGRAELLRAGSSRITGQVRVWVDGNEGRPVSYAVGGYSVLA
jgi:uncharacterized protein (TIGR00369 family)